MSSKISDYKKDQLPGGKYWNPTKEQEEVLKQLLPNNDICESILGLNDWLSIQRPNFCQKTKSTLVEVKKKKTMTWLDNLAEEKRGAIINLAQKKRTEVEFTTRKEEHILREKRIEVERKKAKEKEERRQSELDKLRSIPIIKTIQELQLEISKIQEDKTCTIPGKEKKKMELLKNQIRIRNKLLGRSKKITFSTAGVQKPFEDLMEEVSNMLEEESTSRKRSNTSVTSSINSRAKKQKQLATQYLTTPEDYGWEGHNT